MRQTRVSALVCAIQPNEAIMLNINQAQTYEQDIQAMYDIISSVYHIKRIEVDNLITLHQDDFLKPKVQQSYNDILSSHVEYVYNLLSKHYKTKVLSKYFSTEGILLTIRNLLDVRYIDQFNEFSRLDNKFEHVER